MSEPVSDDVSPDVIRWLEQFANELGVDAPTAHEIAKILDLASAAARGSARQAAPVACWLAARAGTPLDEAIDLAT